MRRFPPFWGGRPVDAIGRIAKKIGYGIVWLGHAIEHRGRCHLCGDFSPRARVCSSCKEIAVCARCVLPDERVRGCKSGGALASCFRCGSLTAGRLER